MHEYGKINQINVWMVVVYDNVDYRERHSHYKLQPTLAATVKGEISQTYLRE